MPPLRNLTWVENGDFMDWSVVGGVAVVFIIILIAVLASKKTD
ncbi:MAG: hypothetical protein P8O79_09760 [Halieaceae bacterium]|nr:hypothetical protein [Halieaceae bacterium]